MTVGQKQFLTLQTARFWLKFVVVTPNQLTAAALVMSFWVEPASTNPGVWIAISLVLIILINFWLTPRIGQLEFWLSSFKIFVTIGLIVLSLVLALGGGPNHDRTGFRYWKKPGAFAVSEQQGSSGVILTVWRIMPSATFAFLGIEVLGMTINRVPNPQATIPRAIQLTFCRILVFYILSLTLVGMLVPYNSRGLAFAPDPSRPVAASVFVAAIRLAGIRVLPGLLNGCILVFVLGVANYDLYMATKVLYCLAHEGKAPKFLARTNARGLPVYALAVCSTPAVSAFATVSGSSQAVFGSFLNIVTMLGLITWVSILVTHISFVRARTAQRVPDEALVYRAPFGTAGSWVAIALCIVIGLSQALDVFSLEPEQRRPHYKALITSYIGLPLFVAILVSHKVLRGGRMLSADQVDLGTRKEAVAAEAGDAAAGRRSWLHRAITLWLL